MSGNAGEDGAHASSDDLLETFDEREFFLIEREVFGDCEDDARRVPFFQLDCYVVDEEFVAGNGQGELGIEVCEVREPLGEFVAQTWVGEDLPVTVAFAALHERRDECCSVEPPDMRRLGEFRLQIALSEGLIIFGDRGAEAEVLLRSWKNRDQL